MFVVEFTPAAVRDLKRIDPGVRKKLLGETRVLEPDPFPKGTPQIKLLAGIRPPHFRLRSGDYRIVYRIERKTVVVVRIAHRREVYRF